MSNQERRGDGNHAAAPLDYNTEKARADRAQKKFDQLLQDRDRDAEVNSDAARQRRMKRTDDAHKTAFTYNREDAIAGRTDAAIGVGLGLGTKMPPTEDDDADPVEAAKARREARLKGGQ